MSETQPGSERIDRTDAPRRDAWVVRLLRLLGSEPTLLIATAYLLASFIGVWCSYWFYRGFGIPILSYLQASDFLIAGLRDPVYLLALFVFGVLAWLISLPALMLARSPQRIERYRRHWWGRLLFWRRFQDWNAHVRSSVGPETGITVGLISGGLGLLLGYAHADVATIRSGGGHRVAVTLSGATDPLSGEARLLGTSSGYVFLYWPQGRRAEAVAIDTVGRIESLPERAPRPTSPKPAVAQ